MQIPTLEEQFPGLLLDRGCHSISEAEAHADRAAGSVGLSVRVASWTGDGSVRTLSYQDTDNRLRLTVQIREDRLRWSHPAWLFECSGMLLDLKLTIYSFHEPALRIHSFEKDVKTVVDLLRSVRTENSSRAIGWLKSWNAARGTGLIECAPGVHVNLAAKDLCGIDTRSLHCKDFFSFNIEQNVRVRRAVMVRRSYR